MSISCLEKIACSLPLFGPLFAGIEIRDAHGKAERNIAQAASIRSDALSLHATHLRHGTIFQDRPNFQQLITEHSQEASAYLEKKRVYCIYGIVGNILSITMVGLAALGIFSLIAVPLATAPFILWVGAYVYGLYETNRSVEHIKRLDQPLPA